ncbi:hypothetical protein ACHAWF_001983 [Thalassiosira exigua]
MGCRCSRALLPPPSPSDRIDSAPRAARPAAGGEPSRNPMPPDPASAPAPPRILCLHGARSNDDISLCQVAGLRLSDRAECVYLHAPHVVADAYPGLRQISPGPWYAWADADAGEGSDGWPAQWVRSLEYLARYCKERGPFDGVYGFSQGASIATNFSHPGVWRDRFGLERCPWKFAVLACAGGSSRIDLKEEGSPIDLPSFHIYGEKDPYLSDSRRVAGYWDETNRVEHTHARGHEIDVRMRVREKELMAKLNQFVGQQLPSQPRSPLPASNV